MAAGKYRNKHTWYDSSTWGAHEELLAEGVSAGRGWAVVRNWHPEPQYRSDRAEKFILRIDVSEWYTAYGRVYSGEKCAEMQRLCRSVQIGKSKGVWFSNMSPGWWENGFSQQLCLESVVFKYESEEDRLRSVVETGSDWDSLDYGALVAGVCERLDPMFRLFAEIARPAEPYRDDF